MKNRVDFTLYLITDRKQTNGKDLLDVLESALKGGVKAIQLREKDLSTKDLYELARSLRKLTADYGAKLIINDRADIAIAVDADGVHLGNSSMPLYKIRKIIGDNRLIGVSCHNQLNLITAEEKGADFVTFGPIYQTPSKVIYGHPVGLNALTDVTETSTIPVFALGGIKKQRIGEVLDKGASGIAAVSAIISAENPEVESREIITLISRIKNN